MGKTKRNRYSAEFKAKVSLEAIKGEHTISELGSRYGLHPNIITNWKRQAIKNMAETFSGKAERSRTDGDAQIKDLHAKIGELTGGTRFFSQSFRTLSLSCYRRKTDLTITQSMAGHQRRNRARTLAPAMHQRYLHPTQQKAVEPGVKRVTASGGQITGRHPERLLFWFVAFADSHWTPLVGELFWHFN